MLLRTRGRATLAEAEPMMEATLGANMRAADIMIWRGVCVRGRSKERGDDCTLLQKVWRRIRGDRCEMNTVWC